MVVVMPSGKHETGISSSLAGNSGKVAMCFTEDRFKHNQDIVLKLREEQELSQCYLVFVCFFFFLPHQWAKNLASETTNYKA